MASSSQSDQTSWVVLGKLGKTHGVKGWMTVRSFCETPEDIFDYHPWTLLSESKGQHAKKSIVWQGEPDSVECQTNRLLVKFDKWSNPEAAQSWVGLEVAVEEALLPPLPEGDFYHHQLEGLSVIANSGKCLGTVTEVMETGANDVLVVRPAFATTDTADPADLKVAGSESKDRLKKNKANNKDHLIPLVWGQVVKSVSISQGTIEVDWEEDFL